MFERLWRAEHRHDTVTHEAHHAAAPLVDKGNDLLEVTIEKADNLLRSHALAAGGVAAYVGKHDADRCPFSAQLRPDPPGQYFLQDRRTDITRERRPQPAAFTQLQECVVALSAAQRRDPRQC